MQLRILYIGCVEFSLTLLNTLHATHPKDIVGIVSKNKSNFNSDFVSLEMFAKTNNIPYLPVDTSGDDLTTWIKSLAPDLIYCFGWSHLLSAEIISIPKLGVVGYHPTLLPQNRGRHPIIWPLVLGHKQTGSTFFIIEEGIDSGDILQQEVVEISFCDDARTLYSKLEVVAKKQIITLTKQFKNNTVCKIKQDTTHTSYFRKRTKEDGEIKWQDSVINIYNLIRALTLPYPGAYFKFNTNEISVFKSEILSQANQTNAPGEVIEHHPQYLDVQCGIGIIRIYKHNNDLEFPKQGDILCKL